MNGRYFRFTSNGNSINEGTHYVEIQIFDSDGVNLAQGLLPSEFPSRVTEWGAEPSAVTDGSYSDPSQYFDMGGGVRSLTLDLGASHEVTSIKIWRYYSDGRTYYDCVVDASEDGVNWSIVYSSDVSGTYAESADGYTITDFVTYALSGSAEYVLAETKNVTAVAKTKITWESSEPTGTSCSVLAKIGDGTYKKCTNGGAIPGIVAGDDLSNVEITIKVEMTSSDRAIAPSLWNLVVKITEGDDDRFLVLTLPEGNTTSIQNAVGEVEVAYSGGTLQGLGGPVAEFSLRFLPENLDAKNHIHSPEHIEVGMEATASLTKVDRRYEYVVDHLQAEISASASLISISDI